MKKIVAKKPNGKKTASKKELSPVFAAANAALIAVSNLPTANQCAAALAVALGRLCGRSDLPLEEAIVIAKSVASDLKEEKT